MTNGALTANGAGSNALNVSGGNARSPEYPDQPQRRLDRRPERYQQCVLEGVRRRS